MKTVKKEGGRKGWMGERVRGCSYQSRVRKEKEGKGKGLPTVKTMK